MFADWRPTLIVVFLLGLGVTACGKQAETVPPRPVLVIQPNAESLSLSAYSGEIRARHEPVLGFRVGGKIARRLVDVGAAVKAGQALAELDPQDLRLQQQAAKAGLANAKAQRDLAEAELNRYRDLLQRKLVGQSLFDAKQSAFQAASAAFDQAKAQASVSDNQADYAVLRAPRAGHIAARHAEAGQVVGAGQPVFTLAEVGEREVAIAIPEPQVDLFKVGRPLFVELWTNPGQRIAGVLREIAPAADPLARTYAARVSLQGKNLNADLGQSARVYAPSANTQALEVPLSALIEADGQHSVWVIDPAQSKVVRRVVTTGAFTESGVPILDGLKADEWVVLAGVHLLREGETVKPLDRNNRPLQSVAAAPAAPAKG